MTDKNTENTSAELITPNGSVLHLDGSAVDQIADLVRDGLEIGARFGSISHPDSDRVAVPVVLVSERDDGGNVTSAVKVAEDILAELDQRMPGPRRRKGMVVLTDADSFCHYLSRYQVFVATMIYADTAAMAFTAVIDEHPLALDAGKLEAAPSAWREFRAQYTCPRSPEWIEWTKHDGAQMKQEAFADFLEARLEDVTSVGDYPKPLELLNVARQLNIRTRGEFRREINPTNGDYILVNKSETDTGSTQIPRAFAITIPVFEGGERYQIEARVRFVISGNGPLFSYTLHRRTEVERDAFNGVRAMIANATKLPVLLGKP